MHRVVVLLSTLVLGSAVPASAQLDQILKEIDTYSRPGVGTSPDAKVGAALKQALQAGTENAVKLTGRTDGYYTNQAIKILMPERLRAVEKGLRTAGYGGEVGTARQYNELLGQAKAIPFLKTENYDLDRYVVGKALDGLFHVVGDEERKIRSDPAARVTSLMKEVFGK